MECASNLFGKLRGLRAPLILKLERETQMGPLRSCASNALENHLAGDALRHSTKHYSNHTINGYL